MTAPDHRARAACSNPIEADVLMDYWLAVLTSADEEALEEHLLACDECGDRLREAIALAEGLAVIADPSGVMVFRTAGNKRMGARFDITKVRSGQVNDPMLQAGDIVMVDESSARTTLRDIKEVLPLSGLFTMLLL